MFPQTEQQITQSHLSFFQERAGDLEELVTAEFSRLRDFLLEEEERIKGKLQKQKVEKLNQLEEALTEATEQISQLETTADQLRLKLREEENPEQLKVRGEGWCLNVYNLSYSIILLMSQWKEEKIKHQLHEENINKQRISACFSS